MSRSRWCCVGIAALVFVAGLGALAEPCTITVQPGESIQAAIDAASPGDVICLAEGEWEESLRIDKSLTLRGVCAQSTIITPLEEDEPEFLILVDGERSIHVTIQGLSMVCDWSGDNEDDAPIMSGLDVRGDAHLTLTDAVITASDGRQYGLFMRGSAEATIRGTTFENLMFGIGLGECAQVTIEDVAFDSNEAAAAAVIDSAKATIVNTSIKGGVGGIAVGYTAELTLVDSSIEGTQYRGLALVDSAVAMIRGSTFRRNDGEGILVDGSAQATIENSVANRNAIGVTTQGSARMRLVNSTIEGNEFVGVAIASAGRATIENCSILGNQHFGVLLVEPPCIPGVEFTGYVAGSGNTIPGPDEEDGNQEGAVCPDELDFLMTEEGGELDQRE